MGVQRGGRGQRADLATKYGTSWYAPAPGPTIDFIASGSKLGRAAARVGISPTRLTHLLLLYDIHLARCAMGSSAAASLVAVPRLRMPNTIGRDGSLAMGER